MKVVDVAGRVYDLVAHVVEVQQPIWLRLSSGVLTQMEVSAAVFRVPRASAAKILGYLKHWGTPYVLPSDTQSWLDSPMFTSRLRQDFAA